MIGNQSTKTCSVQQRITNLVKFQKPPYFNMAFCQFESSLEALNTCFSICTARILQSCSRKKNILFLFFVYVLFFFTDIGLNLVISVTQLLHLFISNHRLNRIFSQLSHLSLSLSHTQTQLRPAMSNVQSHTSKLCRVALKPLELHRKVEIKEFYITSVKGFTKLSGSNNHLKPKNKTKKNKKQKNKIRIRILKYII